MRRPRRAPGAESVNKGPGRRRARKERTLARAASPAPANHRRCRWRWRRTRWPRRAEKYRSLRQPAGHRPALIADCGRPRYSSLARTAAAGADNGGRPGERNPVFWKPRPPKTRGLARSHPDMTGTRPARDARRPCDDCSVMTRARGVGAAGPHRARRTAARGSDGAAGAVTVPHRQEERSALDGAACTVHRHQQAVGCTSHTCTIYCHRTAWDQAGRLDLPRSSRADGADGEAATPA